MSRPRGKVFTLSAPPPPKPAIAFIALLGGAAGIRASGLRRVRLHDLRHSHATHLLIANVHRKIVQERLGHANIATTIDLYTYVMPGMQDKAASRVDAALQAAITKRVASLSLSGGATSAAERRAPGLST